MAIDETKFTLSGREFFVNGRDGEIATETVGEKQGDAGKIVVRTTFSGSTRSRERNATDREVAIYSRQKSQDEARGATRARTGVLQGSPTVRQVVQYLQGKFPQDFD